MEWLSSCSAECQGAVDEGCVVTPLFAEIREIFSCNFGYNAIVY